jgi:hypothetical protein
LSATAAKTTRAPAASASRAIRPAEFQAALDQALRDASADERLAPLLAAARIRMRFEFPDSGLALNVTTDPEQGGLRWSFGEDPGWHPELELAMDSAVANRYLQGRESLAIALARGQARFRGDSRAALVFLPATRLLCEPYRRIVEAEYPGLLSV